LEHGVDCTVFVDFVLFYLYMAIILLDKLQNVWHMTSYLYVNC